MTTIAEFLKQTSNTLYKEAVNASPTPDTSVSISTPSPNPVVSFMGNLAAGAVKNYQNHGSVLPKPAADVVRTGTDLATNWATEATLNDDSRGYQAIAGRLQDNPYYTTINTAIGDDTDRQSAFMKAVRPVITNYAQANGGYANIQRNPQLQKGLIEAISPTATGVVADYALGDMDFVPGTGDDRQFLVQNTWGTSPEYEHILDSGYQNKDYTKTNTAIFPMIDALIDDDLGITAVDYYSQLDENARGTSGLNTTLNGVSSELRRYGIDNIADDLDSLSNSLSSDIGVKGNRVATNAQIHSVLKQKLLQAKAALAKVMQGSKLYKEYGNKKLYKGISDDDVAKIKANAQALRDNPWDDGYYGLLSNPDVRRAVQYVAPWLAYGVPLASFASMMGNNSLWPIILLGGLGSGALGYGGKGWFGEDFIQGADKFFNTVNSPLGQLASMFSPEMARDFNNLTNSRSKSTPAVPEQVSTVPGATPTQSYTEQEFTGEDPFLDIASNDRGLQGNQTTYYQGGSSYPGSAYAGYGQQAPSYYVNQGYNPMRVGSQFLGYA